MSRTVTGLSVLILMISIVFNASQVLAEEHPALILVKDTTDTIKKKIREQDAEIKADIEVLYGLVNNIVLPHFDFRKMASWVLGRNWRKANKAQKQRFTDEFSRLLVRTYSKALYDNIDQQIDIQPIRGTPKPDDITIHTEVQQQGGFPIPIDYKMHLKKGEWKVYDVVIDNISLVANYRTSFNQEIKKSGIDSLIASLAERNKKPVENNAGKSSKK